jgi:hypothetical protein
MTLVFARETFHEAAQDILASTDRTGHQLASDLYLALEKAELLRLHTARENGRLIAFITIFVTQHPHRYRQRWAHVDLIWTEPQRRADGKVLRSSLLTRAEDALAAEGLPWLRVNVTRAEADELKALGYRPVEAIYEKDIG